ncbi:hypothetical protein E2C01_004800 [Portunus trituberculatus]|uniref:Uncharacterized protein n=1 Tax=Portunus trituberculatus TaxID=210409 RepID=A0A5B7CQY9_PORTR|nr:hypothetical protein [Portunus trituberculatus]
MVIYVWKILEEQVPDPTTMLLKFKNSECSGHSCERCALPSSTPGRVKTLLTSSFSHSGPRLFSALPKNVRDTSCLVSRFKKALDHFLQTLPDEPPVLGYTAYCRAASNSVPDQLALLKRDFLTGSSGGPP